MATQTLTDQQHEILCFIISFWGDNGVYPTTREIAKHMEFSSPNAAIGHLKALAKKGAIEWDRNTKSRGVRIARLQTAASQAAETLLAEMGV